LPPMSALLRRFLRPHRGRLSIIAALLLVQAIGNLYLPSLNADIINNGVLTGDTGYILSIGALMLGVTLVQGVSAVAGVYLSAQVAMQVGRQVRSALFRHVQGFSLREVNHFGAPSLITRNTNDVQQVQMFVMLALTMMVAAPVMAVGGVIMAIRENVRLSGLILVVVPLMAVGVGIMVRRTVPLFRVMQLRVDRVNQVTREKLTGMRVIRAFVRTRFEQDRFAAANADLTATALQVNRLFALVFPSLMLILNGSSVAVLWFGGHLVDSGSMPIGNLTAFLSYLTQILFAVMMAVMMLVMVPRATASAERIQDVLTTRPDITDPDRPAPAPPATGRVEFRNVEFRYPGAAEPVLQDITLTVDPGSTTAIVGSTGAGKSTLVNLIPRLYDTSAGSVLVDGVDVREYAREELWARLGLVPQRAFLFDGTVADNLTFAAPDADTEQLWAALDVAQATEFVTALPEGLQARIDQGGANLSGGQRQRMTIARALIRRPAIYVFDDSFSALDYGTDARLRAALPGYTGPATVIIVAQRVSTIMGADRIVVLDRGRVVGTGTHTELFDSCEVYREIVTSQLDTEDLAS
jgi:ATP-binding cassette, subfamily B, multidrug efflux pump